MKRWAPTFAYLGDAHFEAAAKAAAPASISEQAALLWRDGHDAYMTGKREVAANHWQQAVLREPGMADGYLGLILVAPSEERQQLSRLLALTADRIGEQQRAWNRALPASFAPLQFTPVYVRDPDDARLQYARRLMRAGEFEAASLWVAACDPANLRRQALDGRLRLEQGDLHRSVELLQAVHQRDDELREDALISLAVCYERLRFLHSAQESYKKSAQASNQEIAFYSRYRLGRLLISSNDEQEQHMGRALLEQIYAANAGYCDVAKLLNVTGGDNSQPADESWQQIIDAFNGPSAPEGI